MPTKPYQCSRCRRPTGFKHVTIAGTRSVGTYTGNNSRKPEDVELRASCRFCGYVREGARA